jgi:hypothetical protein
MSYTVLTLFALVSLGLIVKHIRFCLSFPSVPGPTSAKWSKIWYLTRIWRGDFEKYDVDAHCGGGTCLIHVLQSDTARETDCLKQPRKSSASVPRGTASTTQPRHASSTALPHLTSRANGTRLGATHASRTTTCSTRQTVTCMGSCGAKSETCTR